MNIEATEGSKELTPAEDEAEFLAAFSGDSEVIEGELEEDIDEEGSAESADLKKSTEDDGQNRQDLDEDPVERELSNLSPSALAAIESRLSASVEEKMSGRLRNLEGNLGGIKQKLDAMATAKAAAEDTGADAPTAKQIREASADGEKMRTLREDFPEFAEAMDERLQSMQGPDLEEYKQKVSSAEQRAATTEQELVNLKREFIGMNISQVHPDWQEVASQPDFHSWVNQQDDSVKRVFNDPAPKPADAIKVLSDFKAAYQSSTAGKSAGRRTTRRLEDAVSPTQGQSSGRGRKTEEEEFNAAFKSVRG